MQLIFDAVLADLVPQSLVSGILVERAQLPLQLGRLLLRLRQFLNIRLHLLVELLALRISQLAAVLFLEACQQGLGLAQILELHLRVGLEEKNLWKVLFQSLLFERGGAHVVELGELLGLDEVGELFDEDGAGVLALQHAQDLVD